MDLRRLEYFVALARDASFTRAAARTGTSQPNLSKQIRELEEELGVELVDRLGKRVRLTAAGEALLPLAEGLLARAEEIRERMAAHRGLRQGRVALGTMLAPSVYLVPRVAARFGRAFPGVELQVQAGSSTAVYSGVREGILQVGLAYLPPAEETGLVGERLFDEELVLVVPRGHPLSRRKRMRIGELAELPLAQAHDLTCRRIVAEAFGAAGIEPKRGVELASLEGLRSMIEQGLGAALLPLMYLRSLGRTPKLHAIRLTDPAPRKAFGLVLHRDRRLGGAAAELVGAIREEVARLLSRDL